MTDHFEKHPMPSSYLEERLTERKAALEKLTEDVDRLEEHLRWAIIFEEEEQRDN